MIEIDASLTITVVESPPYCEEVDGILDQLRALIWGYC